MSVLFSSEHLREVFEKKILLTSSRGIDGLNAKRFSEIYPNFSYKISSDIENGIYSFSPYLEKLILKGKDRLPRVISIPCVKDRLVLTCVHEYIKAQYAVFFKPKMANSLIFETKKCIKLQGDSKYRFIRLDFKDFYPSIVHSILLEKLCILDNKCAMSIINEAINNITIPYDSYLEGRILSNTRGLPQGLPISNILSEIYLLDFDRTISNAVKYYCRYVDDVLIMTDKPDETMSVVRSEVSKYGLFLNEDKCKIYSISDSVEYLGYSLSDHGVSIKTKNTEKFIKKIQKVFNCYRINAKKYNADIAESVFIEDVNMRIAGAFSDNKRYGWIIYYSMTDDITTLHEIDAIIKKNINRYNLLHLQSKVKSIVRAYYCIRGKKWTEYAHNFDDVTTGEMIVALKIRGLYHDDETPTKDEIFLRYRKYVKSQLDDIDSDWGHGYK